MWPRDHPFLFPRFNWHSSRWCCQTARVIRVMSDDVRWWSLRPAQSNRPATYYCPFCNELLHAMSDHVVIAPEDDASRRRHAHMACVIAARKAGEFRTCDEWRRDE